jgi:hypothetical protein
MWLASAATVSGLPSWYVTFEATEDGDAPLASRPPESVLPAECLPADSDPRGNWGFATEGFQLSIRFPQAEVRLGQPVTATLLLRNTTESELGYLAFLGTGTDWPLGELAASDAQYRAVPRTRNPQDKRSLDGSGRWFTLPARTQRKYTVRVDGVFQLARTGDYTVWAMARVPTLDGTGHAEVQSGNALIRIAAREETTESKVASPEAVNEGRTSAAEINHPAQSAATDASPAERRSDFVGRQQLDVPRVETADTTARAMAAAPLAPELSAHSSFLSLNWRLGFWLIMTSLFGTVFFCWLLRRRQR